jgi:enterochelin esterase-like enzyme
VRRAVIALVLVALGLGLALYLALRSGPSYRSTDGAKLTRFTLASRDVGRDLHEILVVPPRHGRTLLVLLHGRGTGPSSWLSQPFFDALRARGPRAPDVLLLDGGDHSYWHDRAGGKWGTMVLREAIPVALARTHARRVAIGGISMGGFGALDLAAREPSRFCAVGAHSAAVWRRSAETPAGAFDDARDFARHDLIAAARRRALFGSRVWLDVGSGDPFRRADAALARALRSQDELVTFHVWPGSHDDRYWRRHVAAYLRF